MTQQNGDSMPTSETEGNVSCPVANDAERWTTVRVGELFEEAEHYDYDGEEARRVADVLNRRGVGFRG